MPETRGIPDAEIEEGDFVWVFPASSYPGPGEVVSINGPVYGVQFGPDEEVLGYTAMRLTLASKAKPKSERPSLIPFPRPDRWPPPFRRIKVSEILGREPDPPTHAEILLRSLVETWEADNMFAFIGHLQEAKEYLDA